MVLLDGERIVAVADGVDPPDGVEVNDLEGATLLPGLVDSHVHLIFDASADPVSALAARDDDAARDTIASAARTAAMGGVTTVRDLGDRGYSTLAMRGTKVMASGGLMTEGTNEAQSQFTVEELRAIVDEAHHLGLPVTAHAHGTPAIVDALAAGVDGLEHATFWTDEGIASTRRDHTTWCETPSSRKCFLA